MTTPLTEAQLRMENAPMKCSCGVCFYKITNAKRHAYHFPNLCRQYTVGIRKYYPLISRKFAARVKLNPAGGFESLTIARKRMFSDSHKSPPIQDAAIYRELRMAHETNRAIFNAMCMRMVYGNPK